MLIDGYQGAVNGYVDYYGHTFPVLNDETYEASTSIGATGAVPYYVLVGRDMTVRYSGGSPPTQTILDEALADAWPEDAAWPEQAEVEIPDGDAGQIDTEGLSPFAADPVTMYEGGSMCALSPAARPAPGPLAALAALALIAVRRRRG